MNSGTIGETAVIASSVVYLALIGTAGWLIHARRIVFAATPKAPARQAGKDKGDPAGGQQDGQDHHTASSM